MGVRIVCVCMLSGLPTLQHHIINLSSPSTFSLCLCVSSVVVASFFIFSIHSCAQAHAHFEIAIRLFYTFFFYRTEQGRVRHFSFRNASELHTQVNLSAGKCMSHSISRRGRKRERECPVHWLKSKGTSKMLWKARKCVSMWLTAYDPSERIIIVLLLRYEKGYYL